MDNMGAFIGCIPVRSHPPGCRAFSKRQAVSCLIGLSPPRGSLRAAPCSDACKAEVSLCTLPVVALRPEPPVVRSKACLFGVSCFLGLPPPRAAAAGTYLLKVYELVKLQRWCQTKALLFMEPSPTINRKNQPFSVRTPSTISLYKNF